MENKVLDQELLNSSPEDGIKYAGFWIRVGATFIDFLAYLPLIALNMANLYLMKILPLQILIALILGIYKPFMEYKFGATLGKMALKIKVVDSDIRGISIKQSLIRYIPWMFGAVASLITTIMLFQHPEFAEAGSFTEVGLLQNSISTPTLNFSFSSFLLISCLTVAFTDKKQGLHDTIAGTYCILN